MSTPSYQPDFDSSFEIPPFSYELEATTHDVPPAPGSHGAQIQVIRQGMESLRPTVIVAPESSGDDLPDLRPLSLQEPILLPEKQENANSRHQPDAGAGSTTTQLRNLQHRPNTLPQPRPKRNSAELYESTNKAGCWETYDGIELSDALTGPSTPIATKQAAFPRPRAKASPGKVHTQIDPPRHPPNSAEQGRTGPVKAPKLPPHRPQSPRVPHPRRSQQPTNHLAEEEALPRVQTEAVLLRERQSQDQLLSRPTAEHDKAATSPSPKLPAHVQRIRPVFRGDHPPHPSRLPQYFNYHIEGGFAGCKPLHYVDQRPAGKRQPQSNPGYSRHEQKSANVGGNVQASSGTAPAVQPSPNSTRATSQGTHFDSPYHRGTPSTSQARRLSDGTIRSMTIADCQAAYAKDRLALVAAMPVSPEATRPPISQQCQATVSLPQGSQIYRSPSRKGFRVDPSAHERNQPPVLIFRTADAIAALRLSERHILDEPMVLESLRDYAAGHVLEVVQEVWKSGPLSVAMAEKLCRVCAQFETPPGATAEETMEALRAFSKYKLDKIREQFDSLPEATDGESIEALKAFSKHCLGLLRQKSTALLRQ